MEIVQSWISVRGAGKSAAGAKLTAEYLERSARFCSCVGHVDADEAGFLGRVGKDRPGRTYLILLDAGGRQMSSEEFAKMIERLRDEGVRRLVLAVGPADGWSEQARGRADMVLSLGMMTLPHELARVVLAEQVYRALTILAGHPYHCGH